MSMFVRAALVAVLCLNVHAMAISADNEKPKLEGQHQIVGGERNGQPVAEADFKGATFRFAGNKLTGANKDGTEFLVAEFTLDSTKSPCAIVIKPTAGSDKDKELFGLIERKDNTIRIIYTGPGGEKPTEFKTKTNQAMYTLKCEK
ncbi:hypothetical protein VT84_27255 [Gemmata sp. SH-PL17]|uniref:TIGR03067 domain-containing protein n=1 Tax=Gemmata sp. SH-PL17 TaxID=1630693 RepID=UPI00078E206B|nr:TIGR03067 domain-containing protein [Gemmata sp. SH-PL17]AMV28134.1 hypothetical protein VT84_27255 [Gemmata sp. SH-PL17]